MKNTILGCGSSAGVPSIGNEWGRCNPLNPKNRRLRPSILIEDQTTFILVDTSPDMRQQLLDARVRRLDAVLYTHAHADHLHGIDDLRSINKILKRALPIYGDRTTLDTIAESFSYVFKTLPQDHGFYRPQLLPNEIKGSFQINHLTVVPIEQSHGHTDSLGFRINNFAYCTDVVEFKPESFELLRGIDTWVVDCFTDEPHNTHSHIEKTLNWSRQLGVKRAILTHLSNRLDYDKLKSVLPPYAEPAYDGLVIEV